MPGPNTHHFTMYLTPDLYKRFKEAAELDGETVQSAAREAFRRYVEDEYAPDRTKKVSSGG